MKPTKKQLKDFAKKHSWLNQMKASKGLDSFNNYSGEGIGHAVVVIDRNRDSEVLAESNFSSALEMLGGESDTVEIHHFSHWGCGWFEFITVSPDDDKALLKAYEIKQALERYPILDESDYSEREYEYQSDYAENVKKDLAEALALHFGLPDELAINKDLVELAYWLNITCKSYYGNDSSIDVYIFRVPDERDIERLIVCMKQLSFNQDVNEAYKYIAACLNLENE